MSLREQVTFNEMMMITALY